MHWSDTLSTHIWIFNVGRGNAGFVRSPLNQGFIVDMAEGEDFDPTAFIEKKLIPHLSPYNKAKIAQAMLSHPHQDHIAQCAKLSHGYREGLLAPALLTCPHDKEPKNGDLSEKLNWKRIVNPKGTEKLIDEYKALYAQRSLPLQTILFDSKRTVPNLEYGIYYVRPPVCETIHEKNDQDYGNSVSVLFYFRHGDSTILFPGDITPEALKHLLLERDGTEKRFTRFDRQFSEGHPMWHSQTADQPSLRALLRKRGLTILVAPHHGLESCFSPDLYEAMVGGKPRLVVISERRHTKDQDGKVHAQYQSEDGASGLNVEIEGKGEFRRSLSTVSGHHVLIVLNGNGSPKVYADKDPQKLLAKIGN